MIDFKTNTIAVEWGVPDVKEVRPDLDDDQCFHVLETAYNEHDANIGINWNTLTAWADYLYPEI